MLPVLTVCFPVCPLLHLLHLILPHDAAPCCRLEPADGPAGPGAGPPHGPDPRGTEKVVRGAPPPAASAAICAQLGGSTGACITPCETRVPPPTAHCPQVLVLRLKTTGTVEDRVVGVASDKAQLADRSITGG